MALQANALRWFYEWAAKGKSYDDLMEKLARNQATVYARMKNATDAAFNHRRAAHVIGIERWSAHRLRVLLGEPLVMDEYDGYAPGEELSLPQLAEEFQSTRNATLALARELKQHGVPITKTVKHNEVGDLSAGGWLFYIENHTGRETISLLRPLFGRAFRRIRDVPE